MMVPFLVSIRTANRAPKRNYLGSTVRAFLAGGCDPWLIHLFPTAPDTAWMAAEVGDLPVVIHAPAQARTPNENGIALVSALDSVDAEWIGLFEDDLECCSDVVGSMSRWLGHHARADVLVYRFFALPGTAIVPRGPAVGRFSLYEMRGSQAVALRAHDARAFAAWAAAHPTDWRPAGAPFQDRPTKGFDKLIGYWALQQWPGQLYGLISQPFMFSHVGRHSLLHTHGVNNVGAFAGKSWRYGEATV